jgi:hypothetical protein
MTICNFKTPDDGLCAHVENETSNCKASHCPIKLIVENYQRPELTEVDKKQAAADAQKLIKKYGFNNIPKMLAALCVENIRLTKEVNEHRAAREIAPLEVFEV